MDVFFGRKNVTSIRHDRLIDYLIEKRRSIPIVARLMRYWLESMAEY